MPNVRTIQHRLGNVFLSEMREVENILEHHGVKGMRWGVHKDYLGTTDIRSGSSGVVTRPLTKRAMNNNPRGPDAFKTAAATHNIGVMLRRRAMAPDSAISKYNAEWRASGKAKKNEHRDEYDREYARLMTKEANKFTKPGTNARVHVIRAKDGHVTIHLTTASSRAINKGYSKGMQSRDDVEIVHAANESPEVIIMEAVLDSDGLIVDFKVSDEVKHDDLTGDDVLMHYGIKGMRWGFRRSDSQLAKARVTNEDGDEEEINVRSSDKGVRQRLKSMRTGEVLVVADKPDSPPKLLIKQADGSFKETRLSADAEKFIKTMNKDPHEMSDREIKEANNRAQAVEQYNKLFNPIPDPNKELQARVDALKLQQTYSQMQAQMNPSRTKRAIGFIQSIEPAFKEFQKIDKMTGGILSKNMNDAWMAIKNDTRTPKVKKTKVKVAPQVANLKIRNPKKGKKNPNVVFNISDVGTPYDASNPFIPALGTRGGS